MKKIIFSFFAVLMVTILSAMPVKSGSSRLLKLADGTEVYAELKGNHLCHYWQTEDGRCFVAMYGSVYKEQPKQMLDLYANPNNLIMMPNRPALSRRVQLGGDHLEYMGMKKGLIILVEYPNLSFKNNHKSEFFKRMANEIGFTDPVGFVGSVKDYFLAQSNNNFELDFDVIGPLKLSQNYEYYGQNTSQGKDANVGAMIVEAINMADEQVNFADYDWDVDGEVDQIFVLYAGMGEAAGGDENTVWPHEWKLEYATGSKYTRDGVVLNTYACGSEILYTAVYNKITGKTQIYQRTGGIGTLCHEFTHCLGIPDFYDTHDTGFAGTGDFDLMCSGSYNEDSFRPANYTAFERIYSGWLKPIELKEPTSVIGMRSMSDYGDAFIIYNDADPNEYYLLENRQKTGWDKAIPAAGLMITHVLYDSIIWKYNIVNSKYTITYRDSVIAQNDHECLSVFYPNFNNGQWAASTALYPCTVQGVLKNSLTNDSDPAAILYKRNSDGTFFMNKPITNIVQNEDGTISFDFMGGSETNVINGITQPIITNLEKSDDCLYDLHGRTISTPHKGIYLRGGRKVVVK